MLPISIETVVMLLSSGKNTLDKEVSYRNFTDKIDLLLGRPYPKQLGMFPAYVASNTYQRANFTVIIKILGAINSGAETPYAIRTASRIARHETISKYLNLCEELGFVDKTEQIYRRKGQMRKTYNLTPDGRQIVSIFPSTSTPTH